MPDKLILLFEDGGRPLARYRLAFPQPEFEGMFSFKEVPCAIFKRTVHIARLLGADGADLVRPLHDAKFLWMMDGQARITGLEVDELTRRRTSQCWDAYFAGSRRCSPAKSDEDKGAPRAPASATK